MELLVLTAYADNDDCLLECGGPAVVAWRSMRLPSSTGSIEWVLAWQAF